MTGCKNVIFWIDSSSSVHTDNKKSDMLLLGEGRTQWLGDTTITVEAKYCISFSRSGRKLCLRLHYSESNSFLFANATKIFQFKAKNSEIKPYPLCLGNISKDFTPNNMKKAGLNRHVYDFSIDHNIFDTSNAIIVHKYLMKKHDITFGFIKRLLIRLLSVCTIWNFCESLYCNCKGPTKCVSLNNHPCQARTTLVNINLDETLLDPLTVAANNCSRSCNTIDDPYPRVCVPNNVKTWMQKYLT